MTQSASVRNSAALISRSGVRLCSHCQYPAALDRGDTQDRNDTAHTRGPSTISASVKWLGRRLIPAKGVAQSESAVSFQAFGTVIAGVREARLGLSRIRRIGAQTLRERQPPEKQR